MGKLSSDVREARFGWVSALVIGGLGLLGGFVVSATSALGFSTPAAKMASIEQVHKDDKDAQAKVDAAQNERLDRVEDMDESLEAIAKAVGAKVEKRGHKRRRDR